MVDDIVKRLREGLPCHGDVCAHRVANACDCAAAADEIERLRAERAQDIRESDTYQELLTRHDRLRAALERIAEGRIPPTSDTNPVQLSYEDLKGIARAAIAAEETVVCDPSMVNLDDAQNMPPGRWMSAPAPATDEKHRPLTYWGGLAAPASASRDAVERLLAYILDSDDDGGDGVFEETVERLARAARASVQPPAALGVCGKRFDVFGEPHPCLRTTGHDGPCADVGDAGTTLAVPTGYACRECNRDDGEHYDRCPHCATVRQSEGVK